MNIQPLPIFEEGRIVSPITNYIVSSFNSIKQIRLIFTVGLSDSYMEASIDRTDNQNENPWNANFKLFSSRYSGKTIHEHVDLGDALCSIWIDHLAKLLPEVAGSQQVSNRGVKILCEIVSPNTRLTISSFGISCDDPLYKKLTHLAFTLVPTVLSSSEVQLKPESIGGNFWNFDEIEKKQEPRTNPHADSDQSVDVKIAGFKCKLLLGISWTTKNSTISPKLLKLSDTVIANINGRRIGLFSKNGKYDQGKNIYKPSIECLEDWNYLQELVQKVKGCTVKPVKLS